MVALTAAAVVGVVELPTRAPGATGHRCTAASYAFGPSDGYGPSPDSANGNYYTDGEDGASGSNGAIGYYGTGGAGDPNPATRCVGPANPTGATGATRSTGATGATGNH